METIRGTTRPIRPDRAPRTTIRPETRKAPTVPNPNPITITRLDPTDATDGGTPSLLFTTVPTPLGCMLVAATEAGVRAVDFGASPTALAAALARRHPTATTVRDDAALRPAVDALLRHLDGHQPRLDLPLDIMGTPFEERVWAALRQIPYGVTRAYGDIARAIGDPTAAREVGEACAANPIALLVPCHRVVRRDGTPGGYRWGTWRKRALLTQEVRAATTADADRATNLAAPPVATQARLLKPLHM